jgi:hypothetical protein
MEVSSSLNIVRTQRQATGAGCWSLESGVQSLESGVSKAHNQRCAPIDFNQGAKSMEHGDILQGSFHTVLLLEITGNLYKDVARCSNTS